MIEFTDLTSRFLAAQLAGDRHAAMRVVVDGVEQGARVIDLQARVIRAAQSEIGRLWQTNRISVAQEHVATGISQMVMTRLFDYAPPPQRNGVTVAVACVEGELHEFPARLVSDYLEHAGFRVRYYGASVPVDEVVKLVETDRPELLALSTTMSFHLGALRATVQRIRAVIATPPPILVGGHAIAWTTALLEELGVETSKPEPEDLVAMARKLTGLAA